MGSVGSDHSAAARHGDRAVEFLRLHHIAASAHVLSLMPSAAAVMLDQAWQCQARPHSTEAHIGFLGRGM
jgi:hypothetical protein